MAQLARSPSPRSRPVSTATDEPQAKRQRLSPPAHERTRTLPYRTGLHLAPMVRIGTLPVRLLALEYGAQLVWGPEIVDKAIIGATRSVDPKTGVVSFSKNGRSIFECHPLEKPRLIFQLGSASPDLAVQALRVIENDVAGVGLNCGCPKAFSLQGGMGAALLKDPERLCSILTALVSATDLPIDAKIRLLPIPSPSASESSSSAAAAAAAAAADSTTPAPSGRASPASSAAPTPSSILEPTLPPTLTVPCTSSDAEEEPTIPLVSRILDTGIANLTVHCRTQSMRSSESALHTRMRALAALGAAKGVPVVCNGDGDGWGNFDAVCAETGVHSVMLARAAEANVSCFRREGVLDPERVVLPLLLRVALATGNHYANTKYIVNAASLHVSPTPPSRERNRALKLAINKARTYDDLCAAFALEPRGVGEEKLEELLPAWVERWARIVRDEGEGGESVPGAEKKEEEEEQPVPRAEEGAEKVEGAQP